MHLRVARTMEEDEDMDGMQGDARTQEMQVQRLKSRISEMKIQVKMTTAHDCDMLNHPCFLDVVITMTMSMMQRGVGFAALTTEGHGKATSSSSKGCT